jgi:hypothetical protein
MNQIERVVARHLAFKYDQKESKQSKVDRLTKRIREATGLSKGMAEGIADAFVRGREVARLAIQKSWPIIQGVIEGPAGQLSLSELSRV